MTFKLTRGILAAGWLLGVGDALRSAGAAVAVLMLHPATEHRATTHRGLFRIKVGVRVSVLEHRAHGTPTGRCSCGHWVRLDSAPTPRGAAAWSKLARFWQWYAHEIAEGRTPEYSWGDDLSKDRSRCHTRRLRSNEPQPVIGRPPRCKRLPSRKHAFGHAPAVHKQLCQSDTDRIAERNWRNRAERAKRWVSK